MTRTEFRNIQARAKGHMPWLTSDERILMATLAGQRSDYLAMRALVCAAWGDNQLGWQRHLKVLITHYPL